nr:BEL1-like homeodomain protein 1 isoform D [Ipomoea batatas]
MLGDPREDCLSVQFLCFALGSSNIFSILIPRILTKSCWLNRQALLGVRCRIGSLMLEFGYGNRWWKRCTWRRSRSKKRVEEEERTKQAKRKQMKKAQHLCNNTKVPLAQKIKTGMILTPQNKPIIIITIHQCPLHQHL